MQVKVKVCGREYVFASDEEALAFTKGCQKYDIDVDAYAFHTEPQSVNSAIADLYERIGIDISK